MDDQLEDAFEQWFEMQRKSTWWTLPSEQGKECPEGWGQGFKDRMRIAFHGAMELLQPVAFVQHHSSGARRAVLCREGMELPDDTTLYALHQQQPDKQQ